MSQTKNRLSKNKLETPLEDEHTDDDTEDCTNCDGACSGSNSSCSLDFERNDIESNSESLGRSTDNVRIVRQNKTFSQEKIREIERKNAFLMGRILSHNHRASRFAIAPFNPKLSSSALNRKKQQQQIDRDNLVLLRKIQTVKPSGMSLSKR